MRKSTNDRRFRIFQAVEDHPERAELTDADISDVLGVTTRTLERWRKNRMVVARNVRLAQQDADRPPCA